jgi:hypothetical protein
MTFRAVGVCLVLLACSSACKSTRSRLAPPPPAVDTGLLAHVPEPEQARIEEARARHAEAREDLAAAQRELAQVSSQLDLAESERASARSRLTDARTACKHARQFGSNEDFANAQSRREEAEAAVRYAAARVDYYEDGKELAERRVDLMEERVDLAAARLELAKARAISELDRPVAADVDVDDYRHAVSAAADDVENARIEALVARERVKLRADFLGHRAEAVPEPLRTPPATSMQKMLESNAYEATEDRLGEDEMKPGEMRTKEAAAEARREREELRAREAKQR